MPAQWMERMQTIQHAGQVNTFQTRVQSWEFAANVALHRPLVGGGFNVYESTAMWSLYGPEDARPRAIHSIYFRVLGEQGFPGIVLFIALLVASWRYCGKVRHRTRKLPAEKWAFDLASMFQASLLAYIAAGFATTSSYFDMSYQIMAMCAILYGLVVARSAASEAHRTAGPSTTRLPAGEALVNSPGTK
jgi:probable O-glycosylation ligase (exosortase A-associated)